MRPYGLNQTVSTYSTTSMLEPFRSSAMRSRACSSRGQQQQQQAKCQSMAWLGSHGVHTLCPYKNRLSLEDNSPVRPGGQVMAN